MFINCFLTDDYKLTMATDEATECPTPRLLSPPSRKGSLFNVVCSVECPRVTGVNNPILALIPRFKRDSREALP